MRKLKCGEYVKYGDFTYLFLGYIDSKFKWCVIADKHGNKLEVNSMLVG
jgi:hypothetical protein